MLHLYILKCADDTLYTGVTNNMGNRFAQHQEGINPTSYTYKRRPVELLYCEGFSDYRLAYDWEKRIKGWSSKKKWALIKGDWQSLKDYSACQNESHYKREG